MSAAKAIMTQMAPKPSKLLPAEARSATSSFFTFTPKNVTSAPTTRTATQIHVHTRQPSVSMMKPATMGPMSVAADMTVPTRPR